MLSHLAGTLRRHKTNLLAVILGQAAGMLGVAVGTRVLTEYASTSTFGMAKLLIGVVTLIFGIILRPFAQFAMREYHDSQREHAGSAFLTYARRKQFLWSLALAILLFAGLLGSRTWGWSLSLLTCVACSVMLVGQAALNLERGMFVTRGKQVLAGLADASQRWLLPLLAAGAIAITVDRPAVLLSAQALGVCALAAGFFLVSWTKTSGAALAVLPRQQIRNWNAQAKLFVLPMLGVGLFQWIVNIGDRYIMADYLSMSDVGRYAAVYGLVSAPMAALGGMATRFLIPFFFRDAAEQRTDSLRRLRKGMILVSLFISVAALAAVALLGDLFASILLAEPYREGARQLMIWLVAGYGFLIVSFAFDMEAYAGKRTGRIKVSYGLAAAVNIALNFLLIPRVGVVGAAQATCATFMVYLGIMIGFSTRTGA